MNMSSACFINLMTNYVFPEPEGLPTKHVNGCFHFSTSSHGSDVSPLYSVCSFMLYLFMILYCVCNFFYWITFKYNYFPIFFIINFFEEKIY